MSCEVAEEITVQDVKRSFVSAVARETASWLMGFSYGHNLYSVGMVPRQSKLFLRCVLVLLRGFAVDLHTPSKTDYGSLYLSSS